MPEISRFYGMVVAMFFNDHDPPHFHVRYAGGSMPRNSRKTGNALEPASP